MFYFLSLPPNQTVSVCMNGYHHVFKSLAFKLVWSNSAFCSLKGFDVEKGELLNMFTLNPTMNSNVMMLIV